MTSGLFATPVCATINSAAVRAAQFGGGALGIGGGGGGLEARKLISIHWRVETDKLRRKWHLFGACYASLRRIVRAV